MSEQTRGSGRVAAAGAAATVVLVAAALLAGCATSKLDTSGAETQISAKLHRAYPTLQVGATNCPSRVRLGEGRTFACTVPVAGKTVHVTVHQDDGHGSVSFRTREYLLQPAVAAAQVRKATVAKITAQDPAASTEAPTVEVSCGSGELVLVAQPGTFTCSVRTPSGSYQEVGTVAADGTVSYTVPHPPSTTIPPAAAATPATS